MVVPNIVEPPRQRPRRAFIHIGNDFMRRTSEVLASITALYVLNAAITGIFYSDQQIQYQNAMEELHSAVNAATMCVNGISSEPNASDAYRLQRENTCSIGVGEAISKVNDELQERHGMGRWAINPFGVILNGGVGPHPYTINVDVKTNTAIVERVR